MRRGGSGEPEDPQSGAGSSSRGERGEWRNRDVRMHQKEDGRKRKEREEDEEEKGEKRDEEDFNPPSRPQEAATFEEYLEKRTFLFLHHFSGCDGDVLATELLRQAEIEDVKLKVISIDREAGTGDLLQDHPYQEHLRWAQEGRVDGYHAGFPCTSFSRPRWRPCPGYPGPVRSKLCPYGLQNNSPSQQEECDRGTILAARAANMGKEVEAHKKPGETIGPFSTLENPPESDHAQHLSAWELMEIKAYTDLVGILNANFHTCAYQQKLPEGQRTLKPQRIAGSLLGIGTLAKFCSCTVELGHVPVVGKAASKAAAVYPKDFCEAYAILAIRHFKKMATQEFLKLKMDSKRAEVEELQEKAAKRRKRKREQGEEEEGEERINKEREPIKLVEWKGGQGAYEMLKEDRKKANNPDQLDYVGGMRDPTRVVERHPTMLNWGKTCTWCGRSSPEKTQVQSKWQRSTVLRNASLTSTS